MRLPGGGGDPARSLPLPNGAPGADEARSAASGDLAWGEIVAVSPFDGRRVVRSVCAVCSGNSTSITIVEPRSAVR